MSQQLNVQFILYLGDSEYARTMYSALQSLDNVTCHWGFTPSNKILSFLHRLHHSKKFGRLNLPLKNVWFKSYCNFDIDDSKTVCFIFEARWMQYKCYQDFVDFLHKRYPNAKYVCYYQDLIRTWPIYARPDALNSKFDVFVSYDRKDAELHNIYYHPTTYSPHMVEKNESIPYSDIYYLGAVKNRLPILKSICTGMTSHGMVCDFYVSGVPEEQREQIKGMHYIKSMSYKENLQHVLKTRCILELVQENCTGETLRTWEAIAYGKALITNNLAIKDSNFYRNDYVSIIQNGDMDIEFIKNYQEHDNDMREAIRPIHFLKFIQSIINEAQ